MTHRREPPPAVLIVDDEPYIRDGLRDFLEDEGFAVDLAANGADAVELARARPYDACIVDVRLPGGMDGTETIVEVMRLRPAVRVIIHTGSQEFTLPQRLRALGIGDEHVMVKPVEDTLALRDRLLALVRGGQRGPQRDDEGGRES